MPRSYKVGFTRWPPSAARTTVIRIPWPHNRCILCLREANLTDEHVIPNALGGRLTVKFLCKDCNDELGKRVEAFVKQDPAIVTAINEFGTVHPKRAKALQEGMRLIVQSERASSKAQIRGNKVRVSSHKLPDGSLIQPTDTARKNVKNILEKKGMEHGPLEEALRKFDSAAPDQPIEIVKGLGIAKWSTTSVQLDLTGPKLNPLVPLKIAFEFLALHLGGAIYDSGPPFQAIRDSLRSDHLTESVTIESLLAEQEEHLHGILFEGNHPHAQVQIRLFGGLAYRVHFKNLAISGTRFVYTHVLHSNEEGVADAQ